MSVAEQLRKAMTEPAPPKGDEAPAKPPADETPATPPAAEEPSSGPEAPPAGSSEGQERPGHKYTRREKLPSGGYRYFYGTEGHGGEQAADIDDSHWSMEDGFRASPAAQLLAGVPIEDAKRVYAALKMNAQLTDAQRTEKLHNLADALNGQAAPTQSAGTPAAPAGHGDAGTPFPELPKTPENGGQNAQAQTASQPSAPAEGEGQGSVADQVRQAMRPPSEEEAAGAAIANASEDEATRKLDEAKAKVAARYIPQIQKTSAEIERLQAEMDRLKANPTKPDLSDLHAKAAARAKASHEAYNAERARIQAEPEARRRVKERLAADETHQAERKELNDLREAARTGYATPEESARQEALNSSLRRRRNAAVKAETEKVVAEMRAAGKIKDEPFEMPKASAERSSGATAPTGTGGEDIRERLQRRTAELRASSAEKDKRLADMLEAAQRTTPQQEAVQAERLRAQQWENERRKLLHGEHQRRIQENSPSAIMNQLRVLFGRQPLSDIDTETGKLLPPRLLWGGAKPSVADQVRQAMQPTATQPASEQAPAPSAGRAEQMPSDEGAASVTDQRQQTTPPPADVVADEKQTASVADQLRRAMQPNSPVERASTRPVSATDAENMRRWAGLDQPGDVATPEHGPTTRDVPAVSAADQLRQAMQPDSPVERVSTRPVSATDAENMRDIPAAVQEPTADDANPAVPASEQPIDAEPVGQGATADDANPAVPASEQPIDAAPVGGETPAVPASEQPSVADQVRQAMQPTQRKGQQKASARVAEISEAPANLREQLGVEPTVTAEKVREHFGLDVPESLRPAPPSDLQRAELKVDKVFRDLWDRREEDPQAKAALEKQFAKRPQLKRDLEAWEAAKNAGVQDVSKQVLAEDNPAIPNEEEPAADAAAISIVHHEADGKSEAEAIQETKDTFGEKATAQGEEQLTPAPSVADQVRETMQPAVREKDAGGEKSTNQGEEQLGASLSEEKPSVADQVREAMQPAVEQPNVEAASEKKAKPAQTSSKRAKATGAAGEKPSVADQVREAMQPAGEEEPVDEHLSGYSRALQQAIREAAQNPDDLGAAAELMMEETGKDERSARNAVRALASRMAQAAKAADPDNRLVQIAGMAEDPEWLKEDFKAALSAPQKLKKYIKEIKDYVGGRHLTALEQIEASLQTKPFSEVRETFARWRGDRRNDGKDTEFADGSVILPLYDRGEEKQHKEEAAAWEKDNRRTDGQTGTAWWEWAEHLLDWQRDGKRSLARLRPVDSATLAKNSGTPRAADPVAVAKFRILGPEEGRSITKLPKDLHALLSPEDDTKANREALLDALDTGFVEAAIHAVNRSVAVKKSTLVAIQRWFEAQKGVML